MKRSATVVITLISAPFLLLIMVILLLFGGGVGDNASNTGRLTGGSALNQSAVPTWAYQALLRAATTCPEITAPILAAQLDTESGWNPNAHNDTSGADGLAQFLPSTWAEWGRDGDADGTADPRNPLDAIASQAAYMCHLAALVKGQPNLVGEPVDLALAAYNAGPGNVQKYHGIPPFLETTNYVQKIRHLATTKYSTIDTAGDATSGAVAAARQWIGTPYAWGGGTLTGPTGGSPPDNGIVGFDCSALVRYAIYQGSGGTITLPRTSQSQYDATKNHTIHLDQLQPGDLLFYGGPTSVHHVALVSGNGRMIEAPQSGQRITETSVRTGGDFLAATRVSSTTV